MILREKRGAVSLGLTVLIIIIIAIIILVILLTAARSYLIGAFNYFDRIISGSSGNGQTPSSATVKTKFAAYYCTSPSQCSPLTGLMTFWYLDYNGVNSSTNLSSSNTISFSDVYGNYSFTAYDIRESGGTVLCSNASSNPNTPGSAYAETGQSYVIYYSQACP